MAAEINDETSGETSEETREETQRKHRQLDPVFKQVIEDEFTAFTEAKLETEVEVSRLPLKIDALVTIQSETELQQICQETPFPYLLRTNQIEFKGRNDRLTVRGYHRIGGRTKLYLSDHDISIHEMSVTIICASKPQKVLAWAETFRPFQQIADGYYKNEEYPPVHLIVINELPIIPKNYPLLMFTASERQFRQLLEQVVAENDTVHLRYAYEIRPQVTREVLMMRQFTTVTRADFEFMASDIGHEIVAVMEPEALLEAIGEKKRQKLLSLLDAKDRLADVSVKDRLADVSVKDRLADVSVKDRLADVSVKDRLADVSMDEMIQEMSPSERKQLLDRLIETFTSGQTNSAE